EPRLAAAVYERTEGNPLFVVELARLLVARGDVSPLAIPTSIRAAIRDRLAALSPTAREVLELAAVIGREFRVAELADAFDLDPIELGDALAESCRAAILVPVDTGRYRFSHILVRGHIYDELARERRAALHVRIAEALQVASA